MQFQIYCWSSINSNGQSCLLEICWEPWESLGFWFCDFKRRWNMLQIKFLSGKFAQLGRNIAIESNLSGIKTLTIQFCFKSSFRMRIQSTVFLHKRWMEKFQTLLTEYFLQRGPLSSLRRMGYRGYRLNRFWK